MLATPTGDGLEACGVVTLLTDFGRRDPYVGALKGILLARAPECTVVDLCHDVPPYDHAAASYVLGQSFHFFPRGTVHLVVVDPGVGTDRAAMLVRTHGHFLVGPDNGCLDAAIELGGLLGCWRIARSDRRVSSTFHGRDLFAPLVGHLAAGQDVSRYTEPFRWRPRRSRSAVRRSRRGRGWLVGRVIWIDHFGNLVTSLRREHVASLGGRGAIVGEVGSTPVTALARAYGDARPGLPFFIWGSGDHLEVSMRKDSVATRLGVGIGCTVRIRR